MIVFVVCGSRLLSGPANAAGIHSSQVNKVEFCVQIAEKDIVMTSSY
ncbi:unknown [Prevotella sp. CAG:1320]|nr:unknown [Prevotella sp. CAG:1320]